MRENELLFYVHPTALCESTLIGKRSKIFAYTHILNGASIGDDCNINDHVFIEDKVVIGNRVTIKCGVQVWNGVTIEDDVFIGPNVTFANDKFPRSRRWLEKSISTVVHQGASIGANSTILPGIIVGKNAMIGAGSVVTKDVPENAVVFGNPAKINRYLPNENRNLNEDSLGSERNGIGFSLFNHLSASDLRGDLIAIDLQTNLPFTPVRFFSVNKVPSSEVRGEHAHKICHQYLIALNGSLKVLLDNGVRRKEFNLSSPDQGLYVPPMIWSTQYNFSHDCVLGVFASHEYEELDYIRTYEQFLSRIHQS